MWTKLIPLPPTQILCRAVTSRAFRAKETCRCKSLPLLLSPPPTTILNAPLQICRCKRCLLFRRCNHRFSRDYLSQTPALPGDSNPSRSGFCSPNANRHQIEASMLHWWVQWRRKGEDELKRVVHSLSHNLLQKINWSWKFVYN